MSRLVSLLLALTVAACGAGGPVALDIVEIGPSRSSGAGGIPPGAGPVSLDVDVRAGQLRTVLYAGAAFHLKLVACGSPDGPGIIVPLDFAGTPVASLTAEQISEDPAMGVLLSATAPREAIAGGRCGRIVSQDGASGPAIVSKPVPLRAS